MAEYFLVGDVVKHIVQEINSGESSVKVTVSPLLYSFGENTWLINLWGETGKISWDRFRVEKKEGGVLEFSW